MLVISQATLETVLTEHPSGGPQDWSQINLSSVVVSSTDDVTAVWSESDVLDTALIFVLDESAVSAVADDSERLQVWRRVNTFAVLARRKRVAIPRSWGQYRVKSRVAFGAFPLSHENFRWVAEFNYGSFKDIVLWRLYRSSENVDLENFKADPDTVQTARSTWLEGFPAAMEHLQGLRAQSEVQTGVTTAVDLDAATFGAVTGGISYDDWLDRLTPRQLEFVNTPSRPSVKLRGPAGSGKTLTLEMKLLKELYRARASENPVRILFATHSWAVAEQVDEALSLLDRTGDLSDVVVLPLLTICEDIIGSEYAQYEILGQDSESGKRRQLEEIDNVSDSFASGDWLAMSAGASLYFRDALNAARGSLLRNTLNWDLMIEFSSVLAANGILPGASALNRYRQIPRSASMLPVANDTDRKIVISLYSGLVRQLRAKGVLTTDQVMNDVLNYLDTFAWNMRREDLGYDAIFVDELHMFTEQERLILQLLARDPENYPVLFMALDPRQSPAELYVNVDPQRITRGDSGLDEDLMGAVNLIELSTIHRFSPEILDLVRHVNQTFPALDLGEDWTLDLDDARSAASSGRVPQLFVSANAQDEVRAIERSVSASVGRVAVIVVDARDLGDYVGFLQFPNSRTVVIDGRDAVDNLRYAKRAVVLGAAEYLSGLQFESVVVVLGSTGTRMLNRTRTLRREISSLYLAISRATQNVTVLACSEYGEIPAVVESGLAAHVLSRVDTELP